MCAKNMQGTSVRLDEEKYIRYSKALQNCIASIFDGQLGVEVLDVDVPYAFEVRVMPEDCRQRGRLVGQDADAAGFTVFSKMEAKRWPKLESIVQCLQGFCKVTVRIVLRGPELKADVRSQGTEYVFGECCIRHLNPIQGTANSQAQTYFLNIWPSVDLLNRLSQNKKFQDANKMSTQPIGVLRLKAKYCVEGYFEFEVQMVSLDLHGQLSYQKSKVNPSIEVSLAVPKKDVAWDTLRSHDYPKWEYRAISKSGVGVDKSVYWAPTHRPAMAGGARRYDGFGFVNTKVPPKGVNFAPPTGGAYMYNRALGYRRSDRNLDWGQGSKRMGVHPVLTKPTGEGGAQSHMSLRAVRLCVTAVLQRSLHRFTHRQALCFADARFSRTGMAPSILAAYLYKAEDKEPSFSALEASATRPGAMDQSLVKNFSMSIPLLSSTRLNVLNEVLEAWDCTINIAAGRANLWTPTGVGGERQPGIFCMKQKAPFEQPDKPAASSQPRDIEKMLGANFLANSERRLLVMYRRSGDGEVRKEYITFNADGSLQDDKCGELQPDGKSFSPGKFRGLQIDMENEETDSARKSHVNVITKEEFMACMLKSTVLAESLRRMTAADSTAVAPDELDVTVQVDTGAGDEEFIEQVDVGKRILLEVWDSDIGKDDFLGEAIITNLEQLTDSTHDFVKPLMPASQETDITNYFGSYSESKVHSTKVFKPPTREGISSGWQKKDMLNKKSNQKQPIRGQVHFSARWQFPAEPPGIVKDGEEVPEDSMDDRQKEEYLRKCHTGALILNLKRCTDVLNCGSGHHLSDPEIRVWIQDEKSGKWRKVGKTAYKPSTLNPVFQEEWHVHLFTGAFEASMDRQGLHQIEVQRKHVTVEFGKHDPMKHGIKVYGSDTVADLMEKVNMALRKLAERDDKERAKRKEGGFSQYFGVQLGLRNILLAYDDPMHIDVHQTDGNIATRMARGYSRMAAGLKERIASMSDADKNTMRQRELKNENNWQPLKTTWRLEDYFTLYRLNEKGPSGKPQPIRALEGTAGYARMNQNYYDEFYKSVEKAGEVDEFGKCSGYALYEHFWEGAHVAEDGAGGGVWGKSTEWPVFAEWRKCTLNHIEDPSMKWKPSVGAEGMLPKIMKNSTPLLALQWAQPAGHALGGVGAGALNDEDASQLLDRRQCVFNPQAPKMGGGDANDFALDDDEQELHEELKKKKRELLQNAAELVHSGVPEPQVVQSVNKQLEAFYQNLVQFESGIQRPKPFSYQGLHDHVRAEKIKKEKARDAGRKK
jgi:hypothetical protein